MRAALALAAALVVLPAAVRARADEGPRPLPRLGLAFDAGVPGGAGAALQLRLLDSVRLAAGPMWSGVGYGAKGGLVVTPFRWAVSPSLEV